MKWEKRGEADEEQIDGQSWVCDEKEQNGLQHLHERRSVQRSIGPSICSSGKENACICAISNISYR